MSMTHARDPWTAAVRRQAQVAVEVAATQYEAAERTLAYYLRTALGHGMTIDEIAEASDMTRDRILELTDSAAA